MHDCVGECLSSFYVQAVEVAVKLLKPHSTDPFYRQQAWFLLQVWIMDVYMLVLWIACFCFVDGSDVHIKHIYGFTFQSYLISVLNLSDADKDLYQLLNQVHYQPMEFNANRLKHISLPQCSNKIARTAFETALKGVFSQFKFYFL